MTHTKYSSPPNQDNIDDERRRAAAAIIGVHQAIDQIRKRSKAFNPTVSIWTRPNWITRGRMMMTKTWFW
ncbi:hypothetical protein ACFL14_02125 [Patescibacteria group bacterium]